MFHLRKAELILVPQMKEGLMSYLETPGCNMKGSVAAWVVSGHWKCLGIQTSDVLWNPEMHGPPWLPASPLSGPHMVASRTYTNEPDGVFYACVPLYLLLAVSRKLFSVVFCVVDSHLGFRIRGKRYCFSIPTPRLRIELETVLLPVLISTVIPIARYENCWLPCPLPLMWAPWQCHLYF